MFFQSKKNRLKQRMEEIRPSLVRLAYSWCNNMSLAEDLVQDTLIKSYNYAHQLREPEKFNRWVVSILNNCWREHLRKDKPTLDIDELVLTDINVTEHSFSQLQIIERVRHAVSLLPNGQKQVVTLIDIQGFSYAEVSEILDIPTGTVMSRLSRARESLRKHLISYHQELNAESSKLRAVK